MIGGSDITIPTLGGSLALDFCIRMVRLEWPQAVYEDAIGEKYIQNYQDLSFSTLTEVFIYRDENAADSWRRLGADSSNFNSMIHLLLSESDITIVVDDPADTETARILDAIFAGLKRDVLTMRAAA